MTPNGNESPRIFILDTNVLMHDPTAIFRFDEHAVHLPMVVLEELDAHKKGMSEAARSVRQVSRHLDDLMKSATKEEIDRGLELPAGLITDKEARRPGRLFFQTRPMAARLPESLPGNLADNSILSYALAIQQQEADAAVTLVSKDINLRIKAAILGVHAEDYYNDRTLEDPDLMYTGIDDLPETFWADHSRNLDSWQESGRTFYRIQGPQVTHWCANQLISIEGDQPLSGMVRKLEDGSAIVEVV